MHALEGRLPDAADLARDADVAVLSARVARKHWPSRSAIGQTFRVRTQTFHVVAVVPDARLSSLDDTSYGQVYLALRGIPSVLLIKARADPARLVQSLVIAVRSG